jgi:hypothetical protein
LVFAPKKNKSATGYGFITQQQGIGVGK